MRLSFAMAIWVLVQHRIAHEAHIFDCLQYNAGVVLGEPVRQGQDVQDDVV